VFINKEPSFFVGNSLFWQGYKQSQKSNVKTANPYVDQDFSGCPYAS
jgi:hypothetical protein